MTGMPSHADLCRAHALRRAAERGVPLDTTRVARLEALLERTRRAWERPDRVRHVVGIRLGMWRFRVVYDVRLACLVTVLRPRPRHITGLEPVIGEA